MRGQVYLHLLSYRLSVWAEVGGQDLRVLSAPLSGGQQVQLRRLMNIET